LSSRLMQSHRLINTHEAVKSTAAAFLEEVGIGAP
jgi:hypothetical protein